MYVLLNGHFSYEDLEPEMQVLVVGVTPEEVEEVVQKASNSLGEEDFLDKEQLMKAIKETGWEVVEIPVVRYVVGDVEVL